MSRKDPLRLWGWFFRQAKARAARVARDPAQLGRILDQANAKMGRHRGAVQEVLDDLKLIFRLLKAWIRGDYREVSLETIILLIAAVIYFLMPIDAMPDLIPGCGYLDDIAVVGFTLASVKGEIDKFRQWEKSKEAGAESRA